MGKSARKSTVQENAETKLWKKIAESKIGKCDSASRNPQDQQSGNTLQNIEGVEEKLRKGACVKLKCYVSASHKLERSDD